MQFSSINAAFVVVEPASIPKKQLPFISFKSFLGTCDLLCLFMNSSCSCLFLNSGSKPSALDKFTPSIFFILFIKYDKLTSGSSFASIEAPIAIYN